MISEETLKLQEKDELLRSVSHDLRNPLGGISSLADILLEQCQLKPEHVELVLVIKEAANHSLRLVEDLLKIENKKAEGTCSPTSHLHRVIKNCVRLLKHRFNKKRQVLELKLFDGNDELCIDSEKLTRVMDNLITNAIKFTPDSGQITITTEQMMQGIQIMVKDNGMGIGESIRAKIFEGSRETQRSGTSGEISHGLGLPICKRIIKNCRGDITFQSKPGKGTVFYVWLPGPYLNIE